MKNLKYTRMIRETPAGGNVFGGASNRSPKGLNETPQSVAQGGSLAARGKRVYSSCGSRRECFDAKSFSNTQLLLEIWKELLKRSTRAITARTPTCNPAFPYQSQFSYFTNPSCFNPLKIPDSDTEVVVCFAYANRSGCAFSMAIPSPTDCSISLSFIPSPKAMVPDLGMSKSSRSCLIAVPLFTFLRITS